MLRQNTNPPEPFFNSSVFKEFETKFERLKSDPEKKVLLVRGPKGCGKSASMLKLYSLHPSRSLYVDLTKHNVNILETNKGIISCEETLFLDNAQNWDSLFYNKSCFPISLACKHVVAVFSPASGHSSLGKDCGDDRKLNFSFRPLKLEECETFVETVLKKKITDEVSDEQSEIDRSTFMEIFFFSRGAPRYVKNLIKSEVGEAIKEINEQHSQCRDKALLETLSIDYATVCKKIIAIQARGFSRNEYCLERLGLAYQVGEKNYLSNPIHLKLAIQAQLSSSALWSWSKLETFSGVLICCKSLEAFNHKKEQLVIPQATKIIEQTEIGDIPTNVKKVNSCVLLKLYEGHPVIDYVLYETQKKSKNIYFIQTSKSLYSKHGKKIDNLNDLLGMTPTCPIQYKEKTIKDHYTDNGSYTSNFVYATTRCSYPLVKEVYVLHMEVPEYD